MILVLMELELLVEVLDKDERLEVMVAQAVEEVILILLQHIVEVVEHLDKD